MGYVERILGERIKREGLFFQVIAVTGPRQTGKTTLCKHLFPDYQYYNLEDGVTREIILSDPRGFIFESPDHIIIDEIQRIPDLFSYIQVCVDENPNKKFIITGSSDFALLENITQSLAGRVALYTLLPFSFKEIKEYTKESSTDYLMLNGFYPGVIVKDIPFPIFYSNYLNTYVERDVRQIKTVENLDTFKTFIRLLAGRVSTEFNANSLSVELGMSAPTIRTWLGVLKTSYIIFSLPPYYANISKRLTKTPKIYFYDCGLLCNLLGISTAEQLELHPLRGAIFENMAVSELLKEKYNTGYLYDLCFYRENGGREVDVLKVNSAEAFLYEIKSSRSFNKSYVKNITYLKELLGSFIKGSKVVYDGPSIPPGVINIRDL